MEKEHDGMFGPRRRAMQREAQLAAEQAAYGVTVLGRANHAQPGLYTQAFFALSIGLERMGKLIFLADHAISNGGVFPKDKELRKFCHNLSSLLSKCEEIGTIISQDQDYMARPNDPIHRGIEEVLSLFATNLRYYNLNHLTGVDRGQEDPVALWWKKVATPIFDRHYSERQRKKDDAIAVNMESRIGETSSVFHTAENGNPIRDINSLFKRVGVTSIVQKYGRQYTMQIIRWLASIIFELSHLGGYKKQTQVLFGLHEPFIIFRQKDNYFRNRKTWSIYSL